MVWLKGILLVGEFLGIRIINFLVVFAKVLAITIPVLRNNYQLFLMFILLIIGVDKLFDWNVVLLVSSFVFARMTLSLYGLFVHNS